MFVIKSDGILRQAGRLRDVRGRTAWVDWSVWVAKGVWVD